MPGSIQIACRHTLGWVGLEVRRLPDSTVFRLRSGLLTMVAWAAGVEGFEAAVLLAADEPQNTSVVDAMADSLAELRAGDGLYIDLIAEMGRQDLPQPPAPMAEVVMMPAEGSLVSLSVSYIDSARSPNSELALRPGLAVSMIVANPRWQVDPTDQAVLPATESVTFSVVITNVGNVVSAEDNLVVTLTGGPDQLRVQVPLDPLEPDQQMTVVVEPMAVEPGGRRVVMGGSRRPAPDTGAGLIISVTLDPLRIVDEQAMIYPVGTMSLETPAPSSCSIRLVGGTSATRWRMAASSRLPMSEWPTAGPTRLPRSTEHSTAVPTRTPF